MSAVLSMSLCVAMLIASEFMPAGLLTPMAEGLSATEGQTGQAISISGFFRDNRQFDTVDGRGGALIASGC